MNTKNKPPIPPELNDRLEESAPEDRASLENVWALLDESRTGYEVESDVDQAWTSVNERISDTKSARRDRPPVRSYRKRNGFLRAGIGSLIVLAILAGIFAWTSRPVVIHVAPGERAMASLPDGSSIMLAGGSSLTYPRGFSRFLWISASERYVRIEGEAFFSVQEDERTFVVETFNARVEVLGTSFEVQAWSHAESPETSVVLNSGEVRVLSKTGADTSVLLRSPGDRSRVIGERATPEVVENSGRLIETLWDQHGFYATNQPLKTILNRLEQRYGQKIVMRSDLAQSRMMTLYYPQAVELEVILNDISTAGELRYRPISGGYELVDNAAE